jgi:hypothetical protein
MSTYNTPPTKLPVHPNKKLRQLKRERAETLRRHINDISRLKHDVVKYRDTLQARGGSITFGIKNEWDTGRDDWVAHCRISGQFIKAMLRSGNREVIYSIDHAIEEVFHDAKKKAHELAREIFP